MQTNETNTHDRASGMLAARTLELACDSGADSSIAAREVGRASEELFRIRRGLIAVGDQTVFFDNNPCGERLKLVLTVCDRFLAAGLKATGASRTEDAYSIGIVIDAPLETVSPVIEAACAELGFAINSTLSGTA